MDELHALRDRYEQVTTAALAMAKAAPKNNEAAAAEILLMAESYVSDAAYFKQKGDIPKSLAALSYAHGWLDCGARLQLFVVHDNKLFTVDPKK